MKKKLILFLCSLYFTLFSQNKVERDTSYTELSTFNKLIKTYPYIKIVKKKEHKNVEEIFDLVYGKSANAPLHFDAFYTKEKTVNPAVLLIHGGGWRSGNKNQMRILAAEIASKGYACFTIEYRLSLEAKYPAGILDVKNAIKYIRKNAKKFHVDAHKIAILGCSSGGQMAALIGTTNKNAAFEEKNNQMSGKASTKVQAIIDIDGVLAFKHPESAEGAIAAQWLGGTFEEKPENWINASALNHVDKNTPPTLFINSSQDRFHAGRDDMIKILNQNNIYNEVHTIAHSPHSFWFFDPWFDQTVGFTIQFLNTIFK
ncbi:MAG: hypothetical protein QG594_2215 [Bacteroidota bacterium]|nr:hypothetical protein [Bacteroidota bacterium]